MKVTILLGSFPWKPSGGAKVALEYANHLAASGSEVEVLFALRMPNWTRPERPPLRRRLKGALLRVAERWFQPRPRWFQLDPAVRTRIVPEYRPQNIPDADAVFATFWPTAEVVADLPKSKGRGYYLIQHLEDWAGEAERVDRTWRFPLEKLFVAKWLYKRALAMGLPSEQLHYVPNSIDAARFAARSPHLGRGPRVAMLYSEAAWKGAADGLAALELAREKVPDLEACLFGVWSRPRDLPEWIEYRCRPSHDELVEEVYGGASIFMCPSWVEGWGLTGAEALVAGCALVTTDNGGAGDYASDGRTALVVPPRDPAAMARAIVRLIKAPELRNRLAAQGGERMQRFTADRSLRHLDRILDAARPELRRARGRAGLGGELGQRHVV